MFDSPRAADPLLFIKESGADIRLKPTSVTQSPSHTSNRSHSPKASRVFRRTADGSPTRPTSPEHFRSSCEHSRIPLTAYGKSAPAAAFTPLGAATVASFTM